MATQYTFGIDGLTQDAILKLLPTRIVKTHLKKMGNSELLTLRNILQATQSAYQCPCDAKLMSNRLTRVDNEMDRRGLTQWLHTRCPTCNELPDLQMGGDGELNGQCKCTEWLNGWVSPIFATGPFS